MAEEGQSNSQNNTIAPINLILLSGGSGMRLWPLSNYTRAKPFLRLLRDSEGRPLSMFQRTLLSIAESKIPARITIASCAAQLPLIQQQSEALGMACDVVLEPSRRDTAPAIMLGCAYLALEKGVRCDEAVVVAPIDSFAERGYYERFADIAAAVRQDVADIVLLGVEPAEPSGKYGYIVSAGSDGESARKVLRFKEKPSSEEAQALIDQGALWNGGVFGFKLGYLLNVLKRYLPSVAEDFEAMRLFEAAPCGDGAEAARPCSEEPGATQPGTEAYSRILARYGELPKNSFDYEVVERSSSVAVVPFAGPWRDLGTWDALTSVMPYESSGRAVLSEDCENVHVVNELDAPVLALGLHDAVVVAAPDGILVADVAKTADMKPYVTQVADTRPMYEPRLWGEYRVLDRHAFSDGTFSLEKILVIRAGKQLSYQSHALRSEVWTVTDGSGQVVLDGAVEDIGRGSVVCVEPGMKHAVRAITDLRIVEVQMGAALEEQDIDRQGYWWD